MHVPSSPISSSLSLMRYRKSLGERIKFWESCKLVNAPQDVLYPAQISLDIVRQLNIDPMVNSKNKQKNR